MILHQILVNLSQVPKPAFCDRIDCECLPLQQIPFILFILDDSKNG